MVVVVVPRLLGSAWKKIMQNSSSATAGTEASVKLPLQYEVEFPDEERESCFFFFFPSFFS